MNRYAVIGHPVDHSRSPEIHGLFARQTRQTLSYGLLPAARDDFAGTARRFFAEGGAGLNVTLPFKQEAAVFADRLSERARLAGAVNTLTRQADGSIDGDNTDGCGLLTDLQQNLGIELAGRRVLILGAGGAVRGVVPVLLTAEPAALIIANRTLDKAQQIAALYPGNDAITACELDDAPHDGDILINAISAGLSGAMPDLSAAIAARATVAYDMIYAAGATPFMAWAENHGVARCHDGLGMLVEQAAESFTIWRGVRPRTSPVIAALRPVGSSASPSV